MECVIDTQSGEIPAPLVRHTCPACRHVTPADRGAKFVACAACGHVIVEGEASLEGFRLYLERHFSQLLDLPRALGAVPEGEYVRDYARVDAEDLVPSHQVAPGIGFGAAAEGARLVNVVGLTIEKILSATEPEQIFGPLTPVQGESKEDVLRSVFRVLARTFHPDRLKSKKAHDATAVLNTLRERAEQKIEAGTYGQAASVTIKAKNTYTDVVPLGAGDISDLYTGYYMPGQIGPAKRVLIKVARSPRDVDLLTNEAKVLTYLHGFKSKEDAHFQRYLPRFIESTSIKVGSMNRPANVLSLTKDSHTLAEVHQAFPGGIEAADMAWMWRRNLEILSWVHDKGYVHGAVIPPHVFVNEDSAAKHHMGRLIDWSYAVKLGEKVKAISSPYEHFYAPEILTKEPVTFATDIYMSAKCAFELLAPDLGRVIPRRVLGLLWACTLARPSARYQSVQEVYTEFEAILREAYGPPRFRSFTMPG